MPIVIDKYYLLEAMPEVYSKLPQSASVPYVHAIVDVI
jgi:hypothetical protein